MNCFCSLNFIYLSQPLLFKQEPDNSCELLLFFEFHIFVTAIRFLSWVDSRCELLLFFEFHIFVTAYPWLSVLHSVCYLIVLNKKSDKYLIKKAGDSGFFYFWSFRTAPIVLLYVYFLSSFFHKKTLTCQTGHL